MAGKHTKGPWVGRPHFNPIMVQGASEVGLELAFACGGGNPNRDEYQANARLIAAAPDLLEVCETVAESLCELEVQARNASRADTVGGLDQATIQRMFARLADALAVEQDALRPVIARATQPLPPPNDEV